jgi:hypothetical protein
MKIYHESYHIAGIAVGNGFTDPITILDYSDFVYEMGLVDTNTYNDMQGVEEAGKMAILEGRLVDAFLVYTTIHNLNCGLPAYRLHLTFGFFLSPLHLQAGWCSGNTIGFYFRDAPIDYRSRNTLL